MVVQQGFAKHRGRGGVREVGLRQEGEVLASLAAPKPPLFIGGGEEGAPPLGFPPLGGAAALDGKGGGGQEGRGEGGAPIWALRPISP